jgi:hypothetical protein
MPVKLNSSSGLLQISSGEQSAAYRCSTINSSYLRTIAGHQSKPPIPATNPEFPNSNLDGSASLQPAASRPAASTGQGRTRIFKTVLRSTSTAA